ncbi:hypothetical protein ACHWQZ_G013812 [Mnemiopsis leidyi]
MSKRPSSSTPAVPLLVLATTLLALSHSKSTIDDTAKLFKNTIKKWNVEIRDKADYDERFARLVETKARVDQTTRGVLLDTLNRFSVNNDAEQAALVAAANLTFSMWSGGEAGGLTAGGGPTNPTQNLSVTDEDLPEEYQYWEKELGMSEIQDQASCGACWSFPNAAALEALYKKLTGEFVVFSKQYFIDCTFSYSGCSGGTINEGYKVTLDRQYMLSEEAWPTTADYKPCLFKQEIASKENNAMRKAWLQDFYPLSKDENGLLKGLGMSPVAFGSYISMNYFGYSGGLYDDSLCASEAMPHAQLLVGYTREYLRVRGSYGVWWGDYGYINYVRASENLPSCRFYDTAFAIAMTHSRDIEYRFCNDSKVATRADCQRSCHEMNNKGETGWTLATIPTRMHNNQLVTMVNSKYPGVKTDDKFNLLWIGLQDLERTETFSWADDYTPVNYFNNTRTTGSGKFGLLNKNTGGWVMKSSLTFEARGLCSRARTCWDISSKINRGTVTYSTEDVDNLVQGTVAKVSCEERCSVRPKKAKKLTCVGGQWKWKGKTILPYCKCKRRG